MLGSAHHRAQLRRLGQALSSALFISIAHPAAAQISSSGLRLELTPILDPQLTARTLVPYAIRVQNRTARAHSGRVVLRASPNITRHLRLDIAAGTTRILRAELPTEPWTDVHASFEVDGQILDDDTASIGSSGWGLIVLLDDPPRLLAPIQEAVFELRDGDTPSVTEVPGRGVTTSVRRERESGEPILPQTSTGWASASLIVTSSTTLSNLPESALEPLLGRVHDGAHLLIFPTGFAEIDTARIQSLLGPVHVAGRGAPSSYGRVPPEVDIQLECVESHPQDFGCTKLVGFGAVHLASYDGAVEYATRPETIELIRFLASWSGSPDLSPMLHLGEERGLEMYYGLDTAYRAGAIRAALDPNEHYRPTLGLVAALMLLYLVFIGPVNFRALRRLDKPLWTPLTTSAIAASTFVLVIVLGYASKGVTSRYRRFETLETTSDDRAAVSHRFTGFFSTFGSSLELVGVAGGSLWRSEATNETEHGVEAGRPSLRIPRMSFWETAIVREDSVVMLSGSVRVHRERADRWQIYNGTDELLRGAVLVHDPDHLISLGDIAPGATIDADLAGARAIGLDQHYLVDKTGYLGIESELELELARSVFYQRPHYTGAPIDMLEGSLWAGISPADPPRSNPSFRRELDFRVLCVHSRRPDSHLPRLERMIRAPSTERLPDDNALLRALGGLPPDIDLGLMNTPEEEESRR